MKIPLAFGFVSVAAAMAVVALAQTGSEEETKPRIRSLSHAIHAVGDLDTTLAFYRDVFGLNGTPNDFPNPAVPLLTNAPGVTLRLSMMRLPGSMLFELTHFKGLERKPARAASYTIPAPAASCSMYGPGHRSNQREKGQCAHRYHRAACRLRSTPPKARFDPSCCAIRMVSSFRPSRKRPRRARRKETCTASRWPIPWRAPNPPRSSTTACSAWNSAAHRRSRRIPPC